jgi:hypothetical protein
MSVLNRLAHAQNRRDEAPNDFVGVLEARLENMTPAQARRVRRVIQQAEKDKE